MRFPREIRFALLAVFPLGLAVTACDNPIGLPPATAENVIDTVTLYALRGTDVQLPSGYDVPTKARARTDLTAFDFAFDIDASGRPLLYPAKALRLSGAVSGIFQSTQPFDSIRVAPDGPYVDSVAVTADPGVVFVVRSHPTYVGCELIGQLPRYGKFRVLAIDPAIRSLTLETLVNQNCGYRSLEPGIPKA